MKTLISTSSPLLLVAAFRFETDTERRKRKCQFQLSAHCFSSDCGRRSLSLHALRFTQYNTNLVRRLHFPATREPLCHQCTMQMPSPTFGENKDSRKYGERTRALLNFNFRSV